MTRKPNPIQQLPTKWLVAIVGALILYGLTQPMLNSRLGWSLPSVAALLGQEQAADTKSDQASESTKTQTTSKTSKTSKPTSETREKSTQDKLVFPAGNGAGATTQEQAVNAAEDLLYGLLKETRPNSENYLSPGGLRYTRGSEEGHRLKHLERHLEDQPARPGKHGVFYGDMPQVLIWLDDAYERGLRGAKGTSKRKEDNRTVFEASFDKPVGYIGGRDGKRDGNPDAKKIRLVVEGETVITAFPF
jgi:hypothetical protein